MNILEHGKTGASLRLISRNKWLLAKGVTCAAMLMMGTLASASLMVQSGTNNSGTDNVLANACDPHVTGPGVDLQGCLNSDHGFFINFTSDEPIKYTGGQASLEAVDGAFSFLDISLAGQNRTFNKLQLNIDATKDGFVTFTSSLGGVSSPFALSAKGENKFIISGDDFMSIAMNTTVDVRAVDLIGDIKQIRVGGMKELRSTQDAVPSPGTILLLGLGVGLLGLRETRRRRFLVKLSAG